MPQLVSTIRPAPGGDGPFYVVTESDGVVANVSIGVASLNTSLDQAKTDQGSIINAGSFTVSRVIITTSAG